MDAPQVDEMSGRTPETDGCDLDRRLPAEARLAEELRQAKEALAALRAHCVDSIRQLQQEITQVGDALHAHQQRIADLEGRLIDVTTSAEQAAVAYRRSEQQLARMEATLTWRVRNRLLLFKPLRVAVQVRGVWPRPGARPRHTPR